MKRDRILIGVLVVFVLLLAAVVGLTYAQGPEPPRPLDSQAALGTGFIYQGQLESGGEPVNDECDFQFTLHDAATLGSQVGVTQSQSISVTGGLFTTQLDFGPGAFPGDARWLGVRVKCPTDPFYVDLGRQSLTAAPYALHALTAPWGGLTGVPADLADGDDDTVYTDTQAVAAVEAAVTLSISVTHATEAVSAGYATTAGDADTLDGQHGGFYRNASNINAGVLGVGYYSAHGDLSSEGFLGDAGGDLAQNNGVLQTNLNSDLLDGQNGSYYQPSIVIGTDTSGETTYLTTSCSQYDGAEVTISASGPGTVIVEANVWLKLDHTNGTTDELLLAIGTTTSDCGSSHNRVRWEIPSEYPTTASSIDQTHTVRRAFSISSAGDYTYYLNGYMVSGYSADTDRFWFSEMQAVFYPD